MARSAKLEHEHVVSLGGNTFCIFPWAGSKAFRTLERYLRNVCLAEAGITSIEGFSPYYLIVKLKQANPSKLIACIQMMDFLEVEKERLLRGEEAPRIEKFDEFIPAELLRKSFVEDRLDMMELQRITARWLTTNKKYQVGDEI